jgi:sugar phosphate isomerase/epimerase
MTPRPVTLFTGQWADMPLDALAAKAAGWGYDGLELACWGDHFEVGRALAEDGYCDQLRERLARHGLAVHAISNHLVGQAVCDPIDARHQSILPAHVWGDGEAEGVRRRAADEMMATARAARRLGVSVVNGFTGSSIWHLLYSFPPVLAGAIDAGFADFAARWRPILDAFADAGVRFALEVHPTEIAFDLPTAERALDAVGGHPAFGFNFDPSHFAYQGADYLAFLDALGEPRAALPREGRVVGAGARRVGRVRRPPRLRRPAPVLGLPLAGARAGRLRGGGARAQPGGVRRGR